MISPTIQKVVPTQAGQLVNYDFFDVATGTGYQTYYAGTVSGAIGVLSPQVFYSNSLNTAANVASMGYVAIIDQDFDLYFNLPQNVRGDAIVSVPLGYTATSATVGTLDCFIKVKIRKWNGTTETEVAEGGSTNWEGVYMDSAGDIAYNIKTAKVTIPNTHFKAGEYLRMTILGYAKERVTPNFNKDFHIYHDPANRASNDGEAGNTPLASGASILKLQLPIKIDV